MNNNFSSGDLTNKRNKRVLFADFTRQREASNLGIRNPINIQNFNGGTNQALAIQNIIEGAQYTTAAEQQSYINEVRPPIPSIPSTIPDPPTNVTAVAGNQQATISFTAPANTGGSPIISYTVTSSPGSITATDSTTSIVVTGLTNGTTYSFTVIATNAVGDSIPSDPSESVIPATVPDPPTGVTAVAGDRQVTISFTAPVNTGGLPITLYVAQSESIFGNIYFGTGITSPITITGLVNGQSYRFVVSANNTIGSSVDSALSNSVTPNPVPTPDAPTLLYILPGNSGAYIYFNPAGTGGTPTNYEYTLDNGSTYTAVSPAKITSPVYISDLINDNLYTIGLRSINSGGQSVISNELTVTPSNSPLPTTYLEFDPNNSSSYSGTGNAVNNIGSYGSLTGTKTAGVTYVTGTGISRNVFDFNGSGTNIVFGSFDFGSTFSINAWVYPRAQNSINTILANIGAGGGTIGFKMAWNAWQFSDGRMIFEAGGPTQWSVPSTVINIVTLNQWQLLTYVFDKVNQTIIFYKNGVPANSSDIITAVNIDTNNPTFNIGSFTDGSYGMDAQLGLLTMFNTTLNAGQVLEYYNNTKSAFGL